MTIAALGGFRQLLLIVMLLTENMKSLAAEAADLLFSLRAWAAEAVEAERRGFEARAAREHHLLSTQVKLLSRCLHTCWCQRLGKAKQTPCIIWGTMKSVCQALTPQLACLSEPLIQPLE